MITAESERREFSRAQARPVIRELANALGPACRRLIVAGSYRRRNPLIHDLEFVFVPKIEGRRMCDFWRLDRVDLAALAIDRLVALGLLAKRPNKNGRFCWGRQNRLALHVATRLPVDLFATAEDCWWNYLVCRTGSKETNMRIAMAAQERGWHWSPYESGFIRPQGLSHVHSEREVFELVGLPYLEPWER
jgi:DNA polymerase/3'-5' exonuclease PolX